jgi:ferrous iron transport protein A
MRNFTPNAPRAGGQSAGPGRAAHAAQGWPQVDAVGHEGPSAPPSRRVRLSELPAGASGRVRELAGERAICVRLREIGFCESAVIEKIAGTRMLICQLCETRIALSEAAASHILVEPF